MKKINNKGFTLIELMITVAIVGIVSAIALPAYQDYTIRAQASEALSLASGAKLQVQEEFALTGSFPSLIPVNLNPVENHVSRIEVEDGIIIATLGGGKVNSKARGRKIALIPTESPSGNIIWNCKSDLLSQYIPADCEHIPFIPESDYEEGEDNEGGQDGEEGNNDGDGEDGNNNGGSQPGDGGGNSDNGYLDLDDFTYYNSMFQIRNNEILAINYTDLDFVETRPDGSKVFALPTDGGFIPTQQRFVEEIVVYPDGTIYTKEPQNMVEPLSENNIKEKWYYPDGSLREKIYNPGGSGEWDETYPPN